MANSIVYFPPKSFSVVRKEIVPSCWNVIRSRSAQPWEMELIQSCDSSASEFPARGLAHPSPTWWMDQMLIICRLGEGSGTPLAQSHAQLGGWWCRRQGSWGESSFFIRNPMAFIVVRLSVRVAGSSRGFWVLTTCFLFGSHRLSMIMSLKVSLK